MNFRAISLGLAFALAIFPAHAGQGIAVQPIYLYRSAAPMQFLSATQLASAVGLASATLAAGVVGTPGIPTTAPGPLIIEMIIENGSVRYTDDGLTTPTASVGNLVVVSAGASLPFQYAGPLNNFKIILSSGSPAITINYYYAN